MAGNGADKRAFFDPKQKYRGFFSIIAHRLDLSEGKYT